VVSRRDRFRGLVPILLPEDLAILLGLGSREEALKLARRRILPVVEYGKRRWFLLKSVLERLKQMEVPAIGDEDLLRRGQGRTSRRGRRP
jgi:hypothetical protein